MLSRVVSVAYRNCLLVTVKAIIKIVSMFEPPPRQEKNSSGFFFLHGKKAHQRKASALAEL